MIAKSDRLIQANYATQRVVKNNIKFIKYDKENNAGVSLEPNGNHLQPPVDQVVMLPSSSLNLSIPEKDQTNSKINIIKRKPNPSQSFMLPNNPLVSLVPEN